jgi:adenylate cyclase class IV
MLLYENLNSHINEEKKVNFQELVSKAKDYSVRTRLADDKVIFVMKLSVDDTTSSNGTARLEFESTVNLSLDELDAILLKSGFTYQAKWSRDRQEFTYKGQTVTIDKNAGYGYLAEFEKVVDSQEKADAARTEIDSFMAQVGALELPQDRLERMFAYYNTHWPEYYGTEKIFDIQ